MIRKEIHCQFHRTGFYQEIWEYFVSNKLRGNRLVTDCFLVKSFSLNGKQKIWKQSLR